MLDIFSTRSTKPLEGFFAGASPTHSTQLWNQEQSISFRRAPIATKAPNLLGNVLTWQSEIPDATVGHIIASTGNYSDIGEWPRPLVLRWWCYLLLDRMSDAEIEKVFSILVNYQESHSIGEKGRDVRSENLKRLEALTSLGDNWNGYGAHPIPNRVIERARQFLSTITPNQQPVIIAPTGRSTIQMEYPDLDTKYLEIEISDDTVAVLYKLPNEDEVELENITKEAALDIIQRYHAR